MKKALITGIAGFAGSHLAEYLLSKNFEIFGFYHPGHSTQNVAGIKDNIKLIDCDLLNQSRLRRELRLIRPDYVFHLAAFSSPAASFQNPRQTLENNIFGQLNLLEALAKSKSKAKILVVGSADEYGDIDPKYLPAKEVTPLSPISPYAVSKVAQDMLGLQFFLHHKLQIVRVRPFNHIGPRQSASFVVSAFAAQIAEMESKGGQTIIVGDLSKVREFTDARDMVKAYLLALEKCLPGEVYNIGTGIPVKIADLLEMLLSLARVRITVKVDKSRIPPVDIKMIYCDPSKFQKATSWKPRIPLLKTLSDTIEYERKKLR
ncbi:hypothetical protein A2697_01005 [Candidatus Curtissbacteria bacterium RIFCSPHIGHO2_01_FULL_41_44]|uniref:NAD(P)-binding domain-containing protein n=1 Tax=Candidatus Curtissbacteria bacterium RIFCSPLOWO2_01_FULL_42_50 TaxID=1797730 RepID=A0A1F5H2S8_9BACT|nr:MAG: hypothetical protein A3C33_02305 [Candidatus Curtissbacteria bacterium RIFCSPHIGHO2_02_FULL_42_58]OGD94829.1 MAG: hypothetical protein A2697_01005 [Candidatus Curtissbacteria bacterium RIFCSPHIGHO2_01_FULL_41_44]OGD96430.1 MAG: hypothetical protein A3E71_02445 [Candidatus Curtissbacteria bacterium RIFCSPHIGHO2_12_FULL_42_33]OGD98456.1 MAG: hypothetical protein A3B54_04285 [Candidatus Curtissbacteria bacterium RIFCSPLOWO2_01_FULL_42_50]OGE02686.1 MAG: hypothetical protein A3G16_01770 [Ca